MLLSEHKKKSNVFKAKRLIEKGGSSYLNQLPWSPQQTIPDHLTTVSTFPYNSKNSSAEHTHTFNTCLCVCARARVCVCVNESVCECVCLSLWVRVFIRVRHVGKVWVYSADEFLERMERLEAVIRNCLLRWSENLVEVAGTPFSISLFALNILVFCAPIRAFFRWFRNA